MVETVVAAYLLDQLHKAVAGDNDESVGRAKLAEATANGRLRAA